MTSVAMPSPAAARRTHADSAIVNVAAVVALFDLLVLPYFPWFIAPMSLAIVLPWALTRFEITRVDRDLRLFFIIAICVALSAGLSFAYRDKPVVVENVKRAGQLLTTFAYYFFFRRVARARRFHFKGVLFAYLFYASAWSLYFLIAPDAATWAIQRFYPSIATLTTSNLVYFRFAYIFADPNTAGYLLAIVALFLLRFGRLGALATSAVLAMLALGIITSGSRGVMLAAGVGVLLWAWRSGIIGRYAFRFAFGAAVLVIGLVIGFRYYQERNPEKTLVATFVYESLMRRMTGAGETSFQDVLLSGKESAGESRLLTYIYAVSNFEPLPLGRGYEITPPPSFRPHSDILRFLYSYGFIAMIAALIFFFRDAWRFEFALVAFMGFAINTLIDEQKLVAVFFVLLALARVEVIRQAMERRRA
jgi:O-Antigen ligase